MTTKNTPPKETDAANQKTEVALNGATCSPRIFRVEASYEFYVVASSSGEATIYISDGVRDEEPTMKAATPVKSIDDVPPEWRDCLPYGPSDYTRDDRSIRDVLENAKLSHPLTQDSEKS